MNKSDRILGTRAITEITVDFNQMETVLRDYTPEQVANIALDPANRTAKIFVVNFRSKGSGERLDIVTPNLKGFSYLRYLARTTKTPSMALEVENYEVMSVQSFGEAIRAITNWLEANRTSEFVGSYRGVAYAFFGWEGNALKAIEVSGQKAENIRLREKDNGVEAFATFTGGRSLYYAKLANRCDLNEANWYEVFKASWEICSISKIGRAGILIVNYGENVGFETINVSGITLENLEAVSFAPTIHCDDILGVIALVPTAEKGRDYFLCQAGRRRTDISLIPVDLMPTDLRRAAGLEYSARHTAQPTA